MLGKLNLYFRYLNKWKIKILSKLLENLLLCEMRPCQEKRGGESIYVLKGKCWALSIFITRDVTTHCYGIRVYPMFKFNTWVSLRLLHTGYTDRHCQMLRTKYVFGILKQKENGDFVKTVRGVGLVENLLLCEKRPCLVEEFFSLFMF